MDQYRDYEEVDIEAEPEEESFFDNVINGTLTFFYFYDSNRKTHM